MREDKTRSSIIGAKVPFCCHEMATSD